MVSSEGLGYSPSGLPTQKEAMGSAVVVGRGVVVGLGGKPVNRDSINAYNRRQNNFCFFLHYNHKVFT